MHRNPVCYRSVIVIFIVILVSNGFAQELMVTNDAMNHAILARMDAVEAGMRGDLYGARDLIDTARKLDPCQLESGVILKILDDVETGVIPRSTAINLFSAFGQLGLREAETIAQSLLNLQSTEHQYVISSLLIGRLFVLSGDPEHALQRYDQVVAINPQIPLVYYWRAELLRQAGEADRAISDLNRCLVLAPFSYQASFTLGSIWLERKDYVKAVHYFENTLSVQPEYAYLLQPNLEICAAYNGRGRLALHAGDQQNALLDFDRAIRLNPRFGEFYLNRGIANRQLGNINAALTDFDRAVLLDAKYIEAYFNRGLLFMRMKNFNQAIKDFERVLGFDLEHIGARYQIGSIYFEQQKYQSAIAIFDSLLKHQPDHYRAVYTRAVALDELRHYRDAAGAYESFFEMAPDSLYDHKIKAWERARSIRKVLYENYGEN